MKKVKILFIISMLTLSAGVTHAEKQGISESCAKKIQQHTESYNKLLKRNKFLNTKFQNSTAAPDYHLNAIRQLRNSCK